MDEVARGKNRSKSKIRARVEHVFGVVKRPWGFGKVRYVGLQKNATRAFTALALANVFLGRQRLLVPALEEFDKAKIARMKSKRSRRYASRCSSDVWSWPERPLGPLPANDAVQPEAAQTTTPLVAVGPKAQLLRHPPTCGVHHMRKPGLHGVLTAGAVAAEDTFNAHKPTDHGASHAAAATKPARGLAPHGPSLSIHASSQAQSSTAGSH